MSLPALLIFAWVGSVLGDNIGYLIGKTICRATITRYGGKIGLTNARISAVEETFSRYGSTTVLFARFFPVLRQLNGIVAGALGMPWCGASCCLMPSEQRCGLEHGCSLLSIFPRTRPQPLSSPTI